MGKTPSPRKQSQASKSEKPRRGRPRDPQRMQRILEAAREHFYAHGFERANIDSIAADAGVSKMTVYSHFTSKEGLFEAVISERTGGIVAAPAGAPPLDPQRPEAALREVGMQFMSLMRDENALGQFRTMYAAAGTKPEACAAFYRQGAGRLIVELSTYLHAAHLASALQVPHPRLAADLFLAMFLGDAHIRGLLKLNKPTRQEDKALALEAVRVFVAAYKRES